MTLSGAGQKVALTCRLELLWAESSCNRLMHGRTCLVHGVLPAQASACVLAGQLLVLVEPQVLLSA